MESLEVAAGDRPTPGFVHHDARELPDIEIVCDMWELPRHVEEGTFLRLRAAHILEHFPHFQTFDMLSLWRSLLVDGGEIHIEVPNLMWQARAIVAKNPMPEEVTVLMYGDQDYDGNAHHVGFTPDSLYRALTGAGFEGVTVEDIGMVLIARGFNGGHY